MSCGEMMQTPNVQESEGDKLSSLLRPVLARFVTALFMFMPMMLAFISSTANAKPEYFFIGDLEGMDDGIKTYLESGDLVMVNGHLDFPPGKTPKNLVFLGDIADRGPNSIRMRKMLMDLQDRYPQRVSLLAGNREAKLEMLRDLPDIEKLRDANYVSFLEKAYQAKFGKPMPTSPSQRARAMNSLNSIDHQVDYWQC